MQLYVVGLAGIAARLSGFAGIAARLAWGCSKAGWGLLLLSAGLAWVAILELQPYTYFLHDPMYHIILNNPLATFVGALQETNQANDAVQVNSMFNSLSQSSLL